MIRSLKIRNLQSHKRTELKFDPGVNVIIGSSDKGKTAILRGLLWLATARPRGTGIYSRWGGKTVVEICTDNTKIKRIRDKATYYKFNNQQFRATRNEVPKEIADQIRLDPASIQRAFDPPFLLSKGSGEVAVHFNRIARLEQIDLAIKQINRWIGQTKNTIAYDSESIADLERQLKEYSKLNRQQLTLERLEGFDKVYQQTVNRISKIQKLVANYQTVEAEILSIKKTTHHSQLVNRLLDQYSQLNDLQKQIDSISEVIDKGTQLDQSLKLAVKKQIRLQNRFNRNFPKQCPLCGGQYAPAQ